MLCSGVLWAISTWIIFMATRLVVGDVLPTFLMLSFDPPAITHTVRPKPGAPEVNNVTMWPLLKYFRGPEANCRDLPS